MDQGELIEELNERTAALQSAMQSGKIAAIELAAEAFCETVDKVKAVRNWSTNPALRGALAGLRDNLDQSRGFARLMSDMTGQMHDLAVSRTRDVRQPVYSRQGARTA